MQLYLKVNLNEFSFAQLHQAHKHEQWYVSQSFRKMKPAKIYHQMHQQCGKSWWIEIRYANGSIDLKNTKLLSLTNNEKTNLPLQIVMPIFKQLNKWFAVID